MRRTFSCSALFLFNSERKTKSSSSELPLAEVRLFPNLTFTSSDGWDGHFLVSVNFRFKISFNFSFSQAVRFSFNS